MKALVIGGVRSGKSSFAQSLAEKYHQADGGALYYAATMIPGDREDNARIKNHRKDREGKGYETIEIGRDIEMLYEKASASGTILLDSITAYLSNQMFSGEGMDLLAYQKVVVELLRVMDHFQNVILVSDHLFSEVPGYGKETEAYRRGLGKIHQTLAEKADLVFECRFGMITCRKGEEIWVESKVY